MLGRTWVRWDLQLNSGVSLGCEPARLWVPCTAVCTERAPIDPRLPRLPPACARSAHKLSSQAHSRHARHTQAAAERSRTPKKAKTIFDTSWLGRWRQAARVRCAPWCTCVASAGSRRPEPEILPRLRPPIPGAPAHTHPRSHDTHVASFHVVVWFQG